MYKKIFILLCFLFTFTLSVAKIQAHGVAVSVQKESGNYTLEFEYSVPEVVEGETTSYVFRLLDKSNSEPVAFDSVLVRFERKSDQSTYSIARITQDELQDGVGRLTLMLNKGDYLINLAFYKGDKKLGEASYDLTVSQAKESRKFPILPVMYVASGFVVGLLTLKFKDWNLLKKS